MKKKLFLLMLVLLSILLVACGSTTTSTPSKPTPVSTASSPVATSPLVGSYATTITQAEIPQDHPERYGPAGAWTVTFANDGSFVVAVNGRHVASAMYQVTQSQLTITDDAMCVQTSGSDAGTGTYTWVLEGKILTLKAVHDTCLARKLVLSIHPLMKQG